MTHSSSESGDFYLFSLRRNDKSYWNLLKGCLSDERKYKIWRNLQRGSKLQEDIAILYLLQRLAMSTIFAITFNNTTSKVFWIMGTQMAVPERTLSALKERGIYKPEDLFGFLRTISTPSLSLFKSHWEQWWTKRSLMWIPTSFRRSPGSASRALQKQRDTMPKLVGTWRRLTCVGRRWLTFPYSRRMWRI